MTCPHCDSRETSSRRRRTSLGYRTSACRACRRTFNERTASPFNDLHYPTNIVLLSVLWRLRYRLSFRDVAELLLQRGFEVTHETIRSWEFRFAPLLAGQLRARRRGRAGESWYVDETYVKVAGRWCYLYRAIDRDGQTSRAITVPPWTVKLRRGSRIASRTRNQTPTGRVRRRRPSCSRHSASGFWCAESRPDWVRDTDLMTRSAPEASKRVLRERVRGGRKGDTDLMTRSAPEASKPVLPERVRGGREGLRRTSYSRTSSTSRDWKSSALHHRQLCVLGRPSQRKRRRNSTCVVSCPPLAESTRADGACHLRAPGALSSPVVPTSAEPNHSAMKSPTSDPSNCSIVASKLQTSSPRDLARFRRKRGAPGLRHHSMSSSATR